MALHDAEDGAQDGRRETQKKTFTRWMNFYLGRHDPPAEVGDLFRDVHDGRILMTLLEELTGCKLLYRFRSSSNRIFRLNNISKALAFLDDRHVKLLGIDASALADGVPAVVLNLVWNIILHFQVKEMTGGLHRSLSSSLSSLSMGSGLTDGPVPYSSRNPAKSPKYNGKTIKTLLLWVQRCTVSFGVEVHDFGRSWRNGMAFLALIKSINPVLVDLSHSLTKEPEENLEQAFRTAQHHLDIPPLLDCRDVTCGCPDEKSIITYVSMFLRHCPDVVKDLSTAVDSSHISKFSSLESLPGRGEDQPVFSSLETSLELLLWKRWARSSFRSEPQNKRRSSSALQPPSPLDAFVANPDIQSWLVKSSDYGYRKMNNNEIHFPLSSEEGVYSVTPLDSDEEDAYSYIMDLNEDVSQSQAKRPESESNGKDGAENEQMNSRTDRMARVTEGHTEKPVDHPQNNDHQLQTHNDLVTDKVQRGKQIRVNGKSMTLRDSCIENSTENKKNEKDNEEFRKLRCRKVMNEADPRLGLKTGDETVVVNGGRETPQVRNITPSKRGGLVQSVAPPCGFNWTELKAMLSLWILLYCCFIVQHIISE